MYALKRMYTTGQQTADRQTRHRILHTHTFPSMDIIINRTTAVQKLPLIHRERLHNVAPVQESAPGQDLRYSKARL